MEATGIFTIEEFVPVDIPASPIATGTPVGLSTMTKRFEGELAGTFNFVHSATTTGSDRQHDFFLIVPGSGTAELAGITGGGALVIDDDGTHHIDLDYSFE